MGSDWLYALISEQALACWLAGDAPGLHRALGLNPWELNPLDATSPEPPERANAYHDSFSKAWRLRQALIEIAGPSERRRSE